MSFSKTLLLGAIARFAVGVGCAPLYVAAQKLSAEWFDAQWFGVLNGVWNAVCGLGGALSSRPLTLIIEKVGWRWSFRGLSIATALNAVLAFVYIQDSAAAAGFGSASGVAPAPARPALGFWRTIWRNFLATVPNRRYAIAVCWTVCVFVPFNGLAGMWAGPYLRDVLAMEDATAGLVLLCFSLPNVVGSLTCAEVGRRFGGHRIMLVGSGIVEAASFLVLALRDDLGVWQITLLWVSLNCGPQPATNLTYYWLRGFYDADLVGSLMGFLNFFWWFSGAVGQNAMGAAIRSYGRSERGEYFAIGYRNGLWWPGAVLSALSIVPAVFMGPRDPTPTEEAPDQKEGAVSEGERDSSGAAFAESAEVAV